MKKIIVTTTINEPTDAIAKYDAMEDWDLIVVGDKKSPKDYQDGLKRGRYIDWKTQKEKYPELCELVGWNSVARGRMIAFVEGYKSGADVIASIDDDCYPYESWGKNVTVGTEIEARYYSGYGIEKDYGIAFNPFQISPGGIWARGYPYELVKAKSVFTPKNMVKVTPLVQVDLCDGDMDLDATLRIGRHLPKTCKFDIREMYFSNSFSPINTQNTFFHRTALPHFYANIPGIGRADDIWAGYIFQGHYPGRTVYAPATCIHKQERSPMSLIKDLDNEIFMYKNTYQFLLDIRDRGVVFASAMTLPDKALRAINAYKGYLHG